MLGIELIQVHIGEIGQSPLHFSATYNEITANIPYPIRFAMPFFEEYIDYSEENPESGSTKIYIPIKL